MPLAGPSSCHTTSQYWSPHLLTHFLHLRFPFLSVAYFPLTISCSSPCSCIPSCRWTLTGGLQEERAQASSVALPGAMVVIGGRSSAGGQVGPVSPLARGPVPSLLARPRPRWRCTAPHWESGAPGRTWPWRLAGAASVLHHVSSTAVQQYSSTSVHQYISTVVQQHSSTAVQQYSSTVVHQYSSTAIHQ